MLSRKKREIIFILPIEQTDGSIVATWAFRKESTVSQTYSGTLADCAAMCTPTMQLIVLLPAQETRLLTLKLPQASHKKRLSMVPYVLSDMLAVQLSQIVYGAVLPGRKQDQDGRCAVVLMAAQRYRFWINQFNIVGLYPMMVSSALLAIPFNKDHFSLCLIDDWLLVRDDFYSGFTIPIAHAPLLLRRHIERYKIPAVFDVFGNGDVIPEWDIPGRYYKHVDTHLASIACKQCDLRQLILFLDNANDSTNNKTTAFQWWLPWRFVFIGTVVWLLLAMTAYGWFGWQAGRKATAIEQLSRQYVEQIIPLSDDMSPRDTLSTQLEQLLQVQEKQPITFFSLFRPIGDAVLAQSDIRVEYFSFANDMLQLTVTAPLLETIEAFVQTLNADNTVNARVEDVVSDIEGNRAIIAVVANGNK